MAFAHAASSESDEGIIRMDFIRTKIGLPNESQNVALDFASRCSHWQGLDRLKHLLASGTCDEYLFRGLVFNSNEYVEQYVEQRLQYLLYRGVPCFRVDLVRAVEKYPRLASHVGNFRGKINESESFT